MSFIYSTYDANQDGPITRQMKSNSQEGVVINNLKVVGRRQTSFPALTGTLAANKASVALNTVNSAVPAAAAAPTQAEFNALVTAYNALATEHTKTTASYRALHDAMRAHGLIG